MSDPIYVEELRFLIERGAEALLALPDTLTDRRPAPGKWSPKEIVGHLIDSASNNHQRFVRAQFQEDLVCPGYDQDAWVLAQGYRSAPWVELVALWQAFNQHLVRVMEAMPEAERLRPRHPHNLHQLAWRPVPESEPATLDYFMADYVGHLKHHLRQVLGASWQGERPTGRGHDSAEGAALAGMSAGAHVLASVSHADDAYVLLDAGTESRRYLYGVNCSRRLGRWFEGSTGNGGGWSSTTHGGGEPNLGTWSIWDDAPDGADLMRIARGEETIEVPVQKGVYLAAWWRQSPESDSPRVQGARINGEWTALD